MVNKYGFTFKDSVLAQDKKRLINQMWKLIPMKENRENWEKQLAIVIEEISGLNRIFFEQVNFLILLSKLEGLYDTQDFMVYRSVVFESIGLLDSLYE